MMQRFVRETWQDIRLAWRQLRRAPAFALTACVTLALGIGANTGVFSIINGFLKPLPVPDADRIVVLAAEYPGDATGFRYRFSYPALRDLREQAAAFSDVFAWDIRLSGLTADGQTSAFMHSAVTGNYFTSLGLVPAAGRLLRGTEGEQPGAEQLVVLGYAYWSTRFAKAPDIIDTVVRINGAPARVVGIAPEGFHGLYGGIEMDGYVSLASAPGSRFSDDRLFNDRALAYLTVVGRLKPGVDIAAAQAMTAVTARRIAADHPPTEAGTTIRLIPERLARPIPVPFVARMLPVARALLLVLAGLVLLLACLNVTNLLFVRATIREREFAVRSALGSGRWRLIRMLLVESLMVTAAGTLLGAFLGRFLGVLLLGSLRLSIDTTIVLDTRFDWRVFTFTFSTALVAGVAVGVLPALRASRTNLAGVLHDGGRGGSSGAARQRLRHALVVAQIAGSLVLLVVAGFFVRSLQRSSQVDVGFEPHQLVTMAVDPRQVGYDQPRTEAFFDAVDRRVRALPGVERAALSWGVPMGYVFWACPVEIEGASTEDRERPSIGYNAVGSTYFETLRLPITKGRAFDERDTKTSVPVTIVNEALAERLWPNADPIGRRIRAACSGDDTLWQVVGVARNSKYIVPFEPQQPYLYLPLAQVATTGLMIQIRSAMPAGELTALVRHELQSIGPDVPVFNVRTMEQAISGGPGFVMFRVAATQATTMGVLGLVLAVVGLYGVVAYSASQRVREIGIRLALGAHARDVRRLILADGTRMVGAGVAIGLCVSVMATMTLTRFVVVVAAIDPLTFGIVTLTLVGVALLACDLPARRAARVDPMQALRHE